MASGSHLLGCGPFSFCRLPQRTTLSPHSCILRRMIRRAGILLTAVALVGCATLRDDLRRAELGYEQARYEDAMVWLASLERDVPAMNAEEQARYYYLRGMTAYRLSRRDEALHFLALGREVAGEQGTGLRRDWKEKLDRTLAELTPEGAGWRARRAEP